MTAGSPRSFSCISFDHRGSELLLEGSRECITLCRPKDSGENVWSSGSHCREGVRALQSSTIKLCGLQSYTGDRCMYGLQGELSSQRQGKRWLVTACCTPRRQGLRIMWGRIHLTIAGECLKTAEFLLGDGRPSRVCYGGQLPRWARPEPPSCRKASILLQIRPIGLQTGMLHYRTIRDWGKGLKDSCTDKSGSSPRRGDLQA